MKKILVNRWFKHFATIDCPEDYPKSAKQITTIGADFTSGESFSFEIVWHNKEADLIPELSIAAPALGLVNTVFLDILSLVAYEIRSDNPEFVPDYFIKLLKLMKLAKLD